jgi:hypothetical protein
MNRMLACCGAIVCYGILATPGTPGFAQKANPDDEMVVTGPTLSKGWEIKATVAIRGQQYPALILQYFDVKAFNRLVVCQLVESKAGGPDVRLELGKCYQMAQDTQHQ